MLTNNITNLISNLINAGFRFTDANPIAIEYGVLEWTKNPAIKGATYRVELQGEPMKLHIGLVPKQGYFARMARGAELDD